MKQRKLEIPMNNAERLAILETTILHINSSIGDIKHAILALDNKVVGLDTKFDDKFTHLENKMDSKFAAVENKFVALENKMDSKFATVDSKFDAVNSRLWSNFLWLMGMIIGLAGLIAHAQHWI